MSHGFWVVPPGLWLLPGSTFGRISDCRLKQDVPNADPVVPHVTLPWAPPVRLLMEEGPRTLQ
jgi:hypothetical protein